jgi:hypothetical protein
MYPSDKELPRMRSLILGGIALGFMAIVGFSSKARAQDLASADLELVKKLNRPVLLERGIDPNTSLRMFLDRTAKKYGVAIKLDTPAFKAKGVDIENEKVTFDKVAGIPLGLLLELVLKQVRAAYEGKDGLVNVIPAAPERKVQFERLDEKRRNFGAAEIKRKLGSGVTLERGLEKIMFDEAKSYFEDRYDLIIVIDYGSFPRKGAYGPFPKKAGERPPWRRNVSLPIMKDIPLDKVLKQLTDQIDADYEIRDDVVLIVSTKNAPKP